MSNHGMSKYLAVNRRVVGSSPTSGAINTIQMSNLQRPPREVALFVLTGWLFWWLLRKFLWLLSRPQLHARLSMSAQPDRNPYSSVAAKVMLRMPRPTSMLIERL